jgi:rhamnulokinase
MASQTVLAADLGAESGRVLAVHYDGGQLQTEELHRFPNIPVLVRGTLHWDILRLWNDIQTGINKATHPAGIGVDTWGVDFALLDRAGKLLGNPVHYRDARTDGMVDYVFSKVPRQDVFMQTGIQIMPINTLYQLASLVKNRDPILDHAHRLLAVPDLLYYWLTGVSVNEWTITTTMQCYNTRSRGWAFALLDKVRIPLHLFGPGLEPGQILGKFGEIPVVLAPHHDTACAVVGTPACTANYAYLSSGTWSLLGVELPEPVINEAALKANITNEGGYGHTFRCLKNIMGLWLLQEARRTWKAAGSDYTYETLTALAEQSAPFVSCVDPDDPVFLPPGDMPKRIGDYCAETDQPVPESVGDVTRCILESLALKYRTVLRQLVALTGQDIDVIHLIGGGSRNALLSQMTADATGCQVIAGPVEATALGNAIVQLIALGELESVAEGRAIVRESFPLTQYVPQDTAAWDAAALRAESLFERRQNP